MVLTVKDIAGRTYSREDFVFFWGHTDGRGRVPGKQCLSQWYEAPMVVRGVYYHCMEQYIMAEKARTFSDTATEELIMAERNQMEIKKLGRRVANYNDELWSAVRQDVSIRGNLAKFVQNEALGDYLLSTGNRILVEASPKDTIWGIGLAEDSPDAIVPSRWKGRNLLGFALMEVRRRLPEVLNDERLRDFIQE